MLVPPAETAERDPSTVAAHRLAVERVLATMRAPADGPLPLGAMAEIAGLSPFHFARVFRRVTGIPPGEFLGVLRLERAKHLLLTTDLSVTDICFEVGYSSLGTFTTRFTDLVGVSPGQLRRLPEAAGAALARLHDSDAPLPVAPAAPGIAGRIAAPADAGAPIFVGLFPGAIPQRRPVVGAILAAPGPFRLATPPDGRYHLLVAALPAARDPLAALLPGDALRVGRGVGTLTVRAGRASGQTDIALRPPLPTDPPVLVALPALLLERLSRAGARPR